MLLRHTALVAVISLTAAAVASAAPAPRPPLLVFGGLDSSQLPSANPADVQVAVGPGAVVETVNASIAIWTTTGVLRKRQDLGSFVSQPGADRTNDAITDPRVLYDLDSGRFFVAVFDIDRTELDIAVSTSSDPTGGWTVYALPSAGCPDQPRLGTSGAVLVVTDDLFSSCGRGAFLGGEVTIVSKPDLLSGLPSPRNTRFGPDRRFAEITPAASLSPTAAEFLVAVDSSGAALDVFRVASTDTSSIPFQKVALRSPLRPAPPAPQAGTSVPVDTGDTRVQNAVWARGRLTLTATEACPGAASRSCVRVVALATSTGSVVLDSVVAAAGRSLYYPAVAPDALGNSLVGFNYSSPSEDPGLAYAYVRPDGVVAPGRVLAPGTAPNESGRFGDYSGAASDGRRVWVAAEIGAPVDGTLGWSTAVAELEAPVQRPAVTLTAARPAGRAVSVTATIYSEGSPTRYRVQYGLTAGYGASTASVRARTAQAAVAVPLRGLLPGRTYHMRVVARNGAGTTAGPDVVTRVPGS